MKKVKKEINDKTNMKFKGIYLEIELKTIFKKIL